MIEWQQVKLKDFCNPKQHKTIPTKNLTPEGYPVFGANGQIGYYSEYSHPNSTIAITCRGATCGQINLAPPKSYINGNAMALNDLDTERVDQAFLIYALQFKGFKSIITGAAQPQITRAPLLNYTISLPNLSEQRRIAKILDRAAELVRLRKEALAKLDVLGQAIFHDMFGDPFTNHMSFCKQRILDFGDVTTGNTPSRKEPKYYGNDIEWVNSNNLNDSDPFVGEASEYLSTVGASKARIAPKNSVLVTCIAGSRESIGNVAMTDRDVAFNQQINSLSLPSEHMCIFIYGQLRFHKELVRAQSRGGMKGIVNKTRFSEVLLLSPPEDLIKDYANKWAHLHVMRKNAEQSLNKSKALRASLINQCFT